MLNAWSIESNGQGDNNALASFTLSDSAVYTELVRVTDVSSSSSSSSNVAILLAVTSNGHLHMFAHDTRDKLRKPLKPSKQVRIESTSGGGGSSIAIIGCFVANKHSERLDTIESASASPQASSGLDKLLANQCIYIVYGSPVNPRIEKLNVDELISVTEKTITLKRKDPFASSVRVETESTKVNSTTQWQGTTKTSEMKQQHTCNKQRLDRDAKCVQRSESTGARLHQHHSDCRTKHRFDTTRDQRLNHQIETKIHRS